MARQQLSGAGGVIAGAVLFVVLAMPGLAISQSPPAAAPSSAPTQTQEAAPGAAAPAAAASTGPAPAPAAVPALPPVPQITVPADGSMAAPLPALPALSAPGSILGTLPGAATTDLPQVPRLTVPPAPPPALTPLQQALQLAPGFVVNRDYARLVQCYGTANYMEAVTRVRAGRAGADQGVRAMLAELIRLQGAMQPMVLIASDARTERRFRTDYTAVGNRLQTQLRASPNAEATLQTNLRLVVGCQRDIARWRGER